MVYDAGRGRLVMFGGAGGASEFGDTWEWSGGRWVLRSPASSPGARSGHAMAYDAARQRVVLFGGGDDQTWEWDGNDWSRRLPSARPSARSGHAMAYDAARRRVVLFGGGDDQTWEWDGKDWSRRSPAIRPSVRTGHAMAYDVLRQRIVLFGGEASFLVVLADTWEWDGTAWLRRDPPAGPSARSGHAMTYDAARQRSVLFGGWSNDVRIGPLAETWEWDGAAWLRTPGSEPSGRLGHAIAYDTGRQVVVLFGGTTRPFGEKPQSDTWLRGSSGWTRISAAMHPGPWPAMAYDVARQRVVLYDGRETWEWDGSRWSERRPLQRPSSSGAMTYDLLRQRVVLFGGDETWEWNGTTWLQQAPTTKPSPRGGHAMAFDLIRRRVVLFGGSTGSLELSDTWEWDGANWSRRSPTTSPSPRSGHAMAYDLRRQRVVLFGGSSWPGSLSDTWEWSGNDWVKFAPAASPSHRFQHAMAYDIGAQRVVLFGGVSNHLWPGFHGDTWRWDGSSWLQVPSAPNPSPRAGHAMAYDQARQRIVVHGGGVWDVNNPTFPAQPATWLFGALTPASARPFGVACSGSAGVPRLASSVPHLGHTGFQLEVLGGRPASPCVIGLASARDSLLLPGGCTLYLKSPLSLPWLVMTNSIGFAETPPLEVPIDNALRALSLYAQGFVLDGQGPTLGLAFTEGRWLMIGD